MRSYVLIIEVDDDLRRSMAELFGHEGIEVVAETDSGRGVSRIMQRNPAAVLMAEEMPALDGVELLPLVRHLTSSPIIVVGEGGETAVVRALLQGADMYLRKPPNHLELLSRIRALLRRSELDPYGRSVELNLSVSGIRLAGRLLGRLAGQAPMPVARPWPRHDVAHAILRFAERARRALPDLGRSRWLWGRKAMGVATRS